MFFQDNLVTGFFTGIILMALLHGLLLAAILLCNKTLKSKSNKYLVISILGVCIILSYELIYWLELENSIPLWVLYLPLYLRTTIPVGIFYFVIFLLNPKHKLSGFEKLGLSRIEIVVSKDNEPSLRVAEKLGATKEGLLRNRLRLLGSPCDAYMHSFIPQDFGLDSIS